MHPAEAGGENGQPRKPRGKRANLGSGEPAAAGAAAEAGAAPKPAAKPRARAPKKPAQAAAPRPGAAPGAWRPAWPVMPGAAAGVGAGGRAGGAGGNPFGVLGGALAALPPLPANIDPAVFFAELQRVTAQYAAAVAAGTVPALAGGARSESVGGTRCAS